jgi:hypothetical protein
MKSLKCDLCEVVVEGETFEQWMNALKPHYASVHSDVIKSKQGTPKEMKAEMEKWMDENRVRFDAA